MRSIISLFLVTVLLQSPANLYGEELENIVLTEGRTLVISRQPLPNPVATTAVLPPNAEVIHPKQIWEYSFALRVPGSPDRILLKKLVSDMGTGGIQSGTGTLPLMKVLQATWKNDTVWLVFKAYRDLEANVISVKATSIVALAEENALVPLSSLEVSHVQSGQIEVVEADGKPRLRLSLKTESATMRFEFVEDKKQGSSWKQEQAQP